MTKKVNKLTWAAILVFALAGLYVTFVQGQTEETAPNMVPYMLKELSSLSEQKSGLEKQLSNREEDMAALKGTKARLEALEYPSGVVDDLETLGTQPASPDSLGRLEDIVRSFHDPFFDLLVSTPTADVDSKVAESYSNIENMVMAHEDKTINPIFTARSDLGLIKNGQDKTKVYNELLDRVAKNLTKEEFGDLRKKCVGFIDTALQDMRREQANDKKTHTDLSNQVKNLGNSLQVSQQKQEKKQELDEALFKWGLPVIITFILLLTVINIIPRVVAIITKNSSLVHEDNENEVLHTVTVFLLIISILILGIRGQIDNASLSTLLAGISGYVLGGQMKKRKEEGTRV